MKQSNKHKPFEAPRPVARRIRQGGARLHPFTWLRGMSATHHSIQPDILKIRQTTPAKHECTQPTIVCTQCDRCVISRVRALSGSSTVVEHLNQPL